MNKRSKGKSADEERGERMNKRWDLDSLHRARKDRKGEGGKNEFNTERKMAYLITRVEERLTFKRVVLKILPGLLSQRCSDS